MNKLFLVAALLTSGLLTAQTFYVISVEGKIFDGLSAGTYAQTADFLKKEALLYVESRYGRVSTGWVLALLAEEK
jgi:hypothetical protein